LRLFNLDSATGSFQSSVMTPPRALFEILRRKLLPDERGIYNSP